jgi:hypothetical protein
MKRLAVVLLTALGLYTFSGVCVPHGTVARVKSGVERRDFIIINSTASTVKFDIQLANGEVLSTELAPFRRKMLTKTVAPLEEYVLFVRPEGQDTYHVDPHVRNRYRTASSTVMFGITSSRGSRDSTTKNLEYEVFTKLIR